MLNRYLYPGLMGGAGLGMMGSGIAGLFGGDNKSFQSANPYYERILKQLPGYFEPYSGAGKAAIPTLQDQYNQLLQNPASLYERFGAGYKESPGYQFRQHEGEQAALNAAAAGGMAGSPQHQRYASQISEDIANQDFNNYLSQIMNLYGLGLQGEQGLGTLGAQLGPQLGEDIASALMSQGNLAYISNLRNQQQKEGSWANLLGGLGMLGGGLASIFL